MIAPFLIFFAVNVKEAINQGVKSNCQRRIYVIVYHNELICYDLLWLFEKISTFVETDIVQVSQRMCARNKFIATFSSLRFHSEIAVTVRHGVGIVRNCKNTVVSPNFLVCKFFGKAQVLHSFV